MTVAASISSLQNFILREVKPVLLKEWIHIFNDTTTLRIAIIIPLFQLLIFGFAINNEVRNVRTAVLDQDRSKQSRQFLDRMEASTYFNIKEYASSKSELLDSLVSGKAQVGIVIPPDYSRSLAGKKTTSLQLLLDGSDSTVANQAASAVQQLGVNVSSEYMLNGRQGSLSSQNS